MSEIWRGTWVVAYREILRFVSDRSRMLSSFAMPLLFLVIFGAGFTKVMGPLARGVNFIQFMYPGIIAMTVLTSSLFAGISVVWDREYGFLKEILVAPLGRTGIVFGKAAGGTVVALLQALVMLVLAPIVGVSDDGAEADPRSDHLVAGALGPRDSDRFVHAVAAGLPGPDPDPDLSAYLLGWGLLPGQ